MSLAGSAITSGNYYFYAATALFLSFLAFAISFRVAHSRIMSRIVSVLLSIGFFVWHGYYLFGLPQAGSSFAIDVNGLGLSEWFVGYAFIAAAAVALSLGAYDWFQVQRRRDAVVSVGFAFMVFFLVLVMGRSMASEFLVMLLTALAGALVLYYQGPSERASDRTPDTTTD